ncbi:ribosome biogenesis protein [Ceratobasidium sp. AG-Ba]|nr:ribosome biogenesis protein [Ceratobasidium sp. AG-Ba]
MAITKPAKGNKGRKQKFDTSSQLKGALRALGGDDQDLELLAGIESDGEASGTKKITGKSQNKLASRELAQFVKSLNLPASVDADQTVATKSKGKGKEKTKDRANDVQQNSNDAAPVKESTKSKLKEKMADKKVEETARKEKSRKDKREDGVGSKKEKELSQGKTQDDRSRTIKPLPSSKPSTSISVSKTLPAATPNKSGKKAKLVVTPASKWYEDLPPITPSGVRLSESKLSALVDRAAALHATDTAAFSDSQFGLSTSDAHFLESVLQGGTRSDRLSALTLVVQGAPVHSTRSLEGLRAMASKKGGRGESLKALRAIVDWWVGGGCPDRKLRYFRDQPVSSSDITDAHLIVWHFEDWLKKYFFSILQLLETLSLDTLPYIRTQTMSLIFTLLKEKPEQEQNLLRLLVNKLGDSDRSVASKASFHILQLLVPHPSMKAVIVREMTSLVLKPQSEQTNAQYYGVITLNQFTLAPGEKDVAAALVSLYFQLFEDILGKGEEPSEEAEEGSKEERTHRPSAREKARLKAKEKGKQASGKGTNGEAVFAETQDSNAKLIAAILTGVHRAIPFAKTDTSIFDKHMHTLFRITHSAPFNISIQALVLIEKVSSANQSISDRFYRTLYDSLLDPRLLTSSKQAMYLNLLFKAMKADTSFRRVTAFVKRLLQSLTVHQPPFICGALYLLGELFSTTPGLRELLQDNEVKRNQIQVAEDVDDPPRGDGSYDPKKRDPQWANAHRTCLWELTPFLTHYHPSVSLHANQLLTGAQLTATPDLGLNTLTHFLDRFVYRNPKKIKPRPVSVLHPAAHDPDGTRVRLMKDTTDSTMNVNDEAFWKKNIKDVPADQLFFHKFFLKKMEKQQARAGKAEKRKKDKADKSEAADSDDESDDSQSGSDSESEAESELGEAEVWKAMQSSMPELQHAGDDSDSIPSGLDDISDGSSSDGSEDSDVGQVEEEDDESESEAPTDGSVAGGQMPNDLGDSSDDEIDFAEDEGDLIELSEGEDVSEEEPSHGKRKKSNKDEEKQKKRRKLPTFASAEDYAKMIDEAPEDDI